MKRKPVDWGSVHNLYKLGKLSNYQIAAQYAADHQNSQTFKPTISEGLIRKQVKLKGWKKSLASTVKSQIKEKVLRSDVRNANLTDEEIVDVESEKGSVLILRHRQELLDFIEHENVLLEKLNIDAKKKGKFAPSTKEQSIVLKNLVDIRSKRILLERQVYDIGEDESTHEKDLEELS